MSTVVEKCTDRVIEDAHSAEVTGLDRPSDASVCGKVYHERHIGRQAIQRCFISDVALNKGEHRSRPERGQVAFFEGPVVEGIKGIESDYSMPLADETFRDKQP